MTTKKKDVTPKTETPETANTVENAVSAPAYPAAWQERVGAFAAAIGMPLNDVTVALKPITGEPGATALAVLASEEFSPMGKIAEALPGVGSGLLAMKVKEYLRVAAPLEAEERSVATAVTGILPQVSDRKSFLESLKTGGELHGDITPLDIEAAIRAAYANNVDYFGLVRRLRDLVEENDIANDWPSGEMFMKLDKMVNKRSHSAVLSALGLTKRVITEKRRNEFFHRVDNYLWKGLHGFFQQLKAWEESDNIGGTRRLEKVFEAALSGRRRASAMMVPDTAPVRGAAESVISNINKIFAGSGIAVARYFAEEEIETGEVLDDPALPAAVGAANKEQMLRAKLGVDVSSYDISQQDNIIQFSLALLKLGRGKVGVSEEVDYLDAMYIVGNSIPWDKLLRGGTKPAPAKKNFQRFNEDE